MEAQQRRVADRAAPCTVNVQIGRSQGCGVIVTADGYVLTAAHVAMRANKRAKITLNDGTEVPARTLGLNREVDAALIKLDTDQTPDGKPWPHASLGTSAPLKAGMWCVAMGHPGGFDGDRGVVARVGRILATRSSALVTDCALIGGDTTAGPLNLSLTVLGHVPTGQALRRDGAAVGDDIYVSGCLGDARWALQQRQAQAWQVGAADQNALMARLERPQPRVALGLALRGVASAAMDLSDGLAGDLPHLLTASGCGATVALNALPLSPQLRALPPKQAQALAASGGDDYELLFCAPSAARNALAELAQTLTLPLTRIGQTEAQSGLRLLDESGNDHAARLRGFDHFAENSKAATIGA
jgi:hypothetical protein